MKSIFVGNLPYEASEDEVRQLFEQHGKVTRVHLVSDRDTGRPKGFGFVDMPNDDEGTAAVAALDGEKLNGRPLRVNEAQPRKPRAGGGGGGGGHRGGGGGGGRRW